MWSCVAGCPPSHPPGSGSDRTFIPTQVSREIRSHQAVNLKYVIARTHQVKKPKKKKIKKTPQSCRCEIFREATSVKGHLDILIWASCFHFTGAVFCICVPDSLTAKADFWHSTKLKCGGCNLRQNSGVCLWAVTMSNLTVNWLALTKNYSLMSKPSAR